MRRGAHAARKALIAADRSGRVHKAEIMMAVQALEDGFFPIRIVVIMTTSRRRPPRRPTTAAEKREIR